ncbi:hypothetical protein D3C80_1585950 [compost metagenome]
MIQTHHSVDVGVFRQQVALNDFHHIIHHTGHAVHAGGDRQQVLAANAAVGITVAFKGITFQRR